MIFIRINLYANFVMILMVLSLVLPFNIANATTKVTDISQQVMLKLLSSKTENNDFIVVDVRSPEEYKEGRIKSAVNLPFSSILENISLLDPYLGKQMIFYCYSGARVNKVTDLLTDLEYKGIFHLDGDIREWQAMGLPLEK